MWLGTVLQEEIFLAKNAISLGNWSPALFSCFWYVCSLLHSYCWLLCQHHALQVLNIMGTFFHLSALCKSLHWEESNSPGCFVSILGYVAQKHWHGGTEFRHAWPIVVNYLSLKMHAFTQFSHLFIIHYVSTSVHYTQQQSKAVARSKLFANNN